MRPAIHGTPNRTKKYVFPPGTGKRVYQMGLAAGGGMALLLAIFHGVGLRRVASPGPVASPHAAFEKHCEACHTSSAATDLRCETCHDPASTEAMRLASHRGFGRRVSPFAPSGQEIHSRTKDDQGLACAECHPDHRGRAFRPVEVDERNCRACHNDVAPSLSRHVEFALIRAKATPPRGLKISHEKHILEIFARSLGRSGAKDLTDAETQRALKGEPLSQTCATCHVATADLTGFLPISFDRHCAACHLKDGSLGATDPVPVGDVVSADLLRGPWVTAAASRLTVSRTGRIAKTALSHRDPWLLFNLRKLREEVDPLGSAAERAHAMSRLAELEARNEGLWQSGPLARLAKADLESRVNGLTGELQALRQRAAGAPTQTSAGNPPGALTEDASFEERRAELLSALEAARRRAQAEPLLLRRVESLRRRVASWQASGPASPDGSSAISEAIALRESERARLLDELARRSKTGSRRDWTAPIPVFASLQAGPAQMNGAPSALATEIRRLLVDLKEPASFATVGLDDSARARRAEAAEAILVACAKCHQTGPARLATLSIEARLFPRALFDHRAHIKTATCGHCHGQGGQGVSGAKTERAVMVPGVAICNGCHRPSQTRSGCMTCHRFHPPEARL